MKQIPNHVGAGIFTQNLEEILLHKRGPERKLYPNCWAFVGGKVKKDESVIVAVKREALEETGLEIEVFPVSVIYEINTKDGFAFGCHLKDETLKDKFQCYEGGELSWWNCSDFISQYSELAENQMVVPDLDRRIELLRLLLLDVRYKTQYFELV